MLLRCLLALLPLTMLAATPLKDGDLVFQDSQSSQCEAIKLATRSPYSHVGIIFFHEGRPFVLEAVQPVVATPFDQWIRRGRDQQYVIRRLRDADKTLTPGAVEALKKEGLRYLKKDYDWQFHWSDDQFYCSELVWKMYERGLGIKLCEPRALRNFDLSHPAVKQKLKERYGDAVPLDEPVVAPSDLYDSKLLVTPAER